VEIRKKEFCVFVLMKLIAVFLLRNKQNFQNILGFLREACLAKAFLFLNSLLLPLVLLQELTSFNNKKKMPIKRQKAKANITINKN
jgi:hypothetical protein